MRDGASHLLFLPHGRGPAREVRLPHEGDFAGARVGEDGAALIFGLNGWLTAREFLAARDGVVSPIGLRSATWSKAGRMRVDRDEATSADGTRVPMVVIGPANARGPLRTVLGGYGAYGAPSVRPAYNPAFLAWVARGNAIAFCGTRGGNERGRAWHEGGRERNKPDAHADYIACAERLIASGRAVKGGIAATGTSAGGLLVPPAVLKRPDLFGALVPRVAVLNPTRLEAAENGPNQFAEMGDPRTPEGFRALAAQDSVLLLPAARDLPDTLVTVGLNDKRVASWESAKFAAAARDRFGKRRLVLVRADTEAGHGVGSLLDVVNAEMADTFAFAEARLKR